MSRVYQKVLPPSFKGQRQRDELSQQGAWRVAGLLGASRRASGKESAPAPAGTQLSSAVISGNKGNIQISNLEVPLGCHGRRRKLSTELAK